MRGLNVEVAKQIDTGSQGPETYSDAVQRALRNESWDRIKTKPVMDKDVETPVPSENTASGEAKRTFKRKFSDGISNGKFGNKGKGN